MVSSTKPTLLDYPQLCVGLGAILLIMLIGNLQRYVHDYRILTRAGEERNETRIDFAPYRVAAKTVRHRGDHRLYYPPDKSISTLLATVAKDTPWNDTAREDGFDKGTLAFVYPPFAALVLEPLSLWRWPLALFLWRIALLAMVLLSVYLSLLIIETDHRLLHFVILVAAILWFFPFTETIYQGQSDPIILLCWVGGVYLLKTDRPVWSALLFAIGTAVKVSPVIVLGLFLMRRQWKWLAHYAFWFSLLLCISIWRLGWENHVMWASQVLPALSQALPNYANKSLSALIYELYLRRVPTDFDFNIPHALAWVVSLVNLGIYGFTLLYFYRKNRKADALIYELTVLALLAVVVSPVAWRHHYLLALLPLTFLWYKSRNDWRDRFVLAAATLAIGTVLIDYVILTIRKPALDLLLASAVPVTTLLLLILALANYVPVTVRRPVQEMPQAA